MATSQTKMAENRLNVNVSSKNSVFLTEDRVRIVKLKVKEGSNITIGQILFQFEPEEDISHGNGDASSLNNGKHFHVFRANSAGLLEKLHIKEGEVVEKGSLILELSSCSHPTVMKDMCAECGADLRETNQRSQTAAVAMVHNIPELMVSMKEAQLLGKADEERLLRDRKLVLLVDLDQTLIHTTNDEIPENIEDVFHFQLHGSPWYHTRLRPFTKQFLASISSLYELHICTFGSRTYAHMIASFLDEEGRYFSHRILSRDECFSAHSKKANLKALFPCGDHMVVIIDDREDVWSFAPNLIHVRPYHFFQHTGDINAPPGLAKQEKDDKEGYDFTSITSGEKSADASPCETSKKSLSEDKKDQDKILPKVVLTDVNCDSKTQTEKESKTDESVAETTSSTEDVKQEDEISVTANEENKIVEAITVTEEEKCSEVGREQVTTEIGEKKQEENDQKPPDESSTKKPKESSKIYIHDTDDYLLHLQDILRTIHHAYYELYDDNRKTGDESKAVPDMKIVLPYARRKVLAKVNLVFSGVVPTNTPLEKSKPYLVAKSLGAVIVDRVSETTTHVIAARLGTVKLSEAKKYRHIRVVTPEWLWACAERWEHVEERLYPLNSELATVRLKPPAHCTSPDVAIQLAITASGKEESEAVAAVYDRVTGKRIFRQSKRSDKGKTLATSRSSNTQQKFSETVNPYLSFSMDEIADMAREVTEDIDTDDEDEEEESMPAGFPGGRNEEENGNTTAITTDDFAELEEVPSRKRKREIADHDFLIGGVIDQDNPENDTLLERFRRGESIPVLDGDEPDDEDSNEPEIDELESDEEVEDSELCLAGQALEREFLSEED